MSERNLNLHLNSTPSKITSGAKITEPVEERQQENPEYRQFVPSFPIPVQFAPLDLRKSSRQKWNSASTSKSSSASSGTCTEIINFVLSDTNPLCSQLFLQSMNYQGKFQRFNSDSSLENPKGMEDGKSEKLSREQQKRRQAQKSRDAERNRQCRMSVCEIQMTAQNSSLHTKLKALEDEKSKLMQLLGVSGQIQ